MPETGDRGSRDEQRGRPTPRKAGLVQLLKQAHEADHEILDANHANLPAGRHDEVEHDDEQQAEGCLTGREPDGG